MVSISRCAATLGQQGVRRVLGRVAVHGRRVDPDDPVHRNPTGPEAVEFSLRPGTRVDIASDEVAERLGNPSPPRAAS